MLILFCFVGRQLPKVERTTVLKDWMGGKKIFNHLPPQIGANQMVTLKQIKSHQILTSSDNETTKKKL